MNKLTKDQFEFLSNDILTKNKTRESTYDCPECNHKMYEHKIDGDWFAICDDCELNFRA